MSDRLEIIIVGKDGATQVFKAVSSGAQTMGKTVEDAGKKGAAGLRDLGKASDDLKIGAAALAAGFAIAARSNIDQQRSIDALMRSYGDAGQEIVRFTNSIEDASNFSDEAARSAAAFGATLVNQYGLSVEQVEALLTRAADLAERTGLSFEDAAQRVTSAIRGEAESAEVFGIAAGDHALHLDQMAASTTDAEKAQLRFNAVMTQSESASGTAQRASEGTRGAVIDLAQSVGDAAQSFAAWTGPVGEAVAGLSNYALQAGIAVGGVVKLAEGVRALTVAQEASTVATEASAVGSAGLLAALGPIGLVAAAGAAAFAIYKLTSGHDDEAEAAKAADQATQDLVTTLHDLAAAGDPTSGSANAWAQALADIADIAAGRLDVVQGKINDITQGGDVTLPVAGATQEEADALQAQLDALVAELATLQTVTGEATDTQINLAKVLRDTGVGADLAQQRLAELFTAFEASPKAAADIQTLNEGIIWIGTNLGNYDDAANAAAEAARQLAIAAGGTADAFDVIGNAVADLPRHFEDTAQGQKVLADLQVIATQGTDDQRAAIAKLWPEAQKSDKAFAIWENTVALYANTARDAADATEQSASAASRSAQRWNEYDDAVRLAAQADADKAKANRELLASMSPQAVSEADRLDRDKQKWAEYDAAVRAANDTRVQSTDAAAAYLAALEAERAQLDGNALSHDALAQAIDATNLTMEDFAGDALRLNDVQRTLNDSTEAAAAAFRANETALDRMARGSTSAGVALRAFKDIQDGLLDSESVFSQQASEYSQQVNAMSDAHDILLERQANGVELTKEQTDFLNQYDEAMGRAQGGVEDATIAEGLLAEQYALNMKKGDQLNQTLEGVSGGVADLTGAIRALIAALDGVPDDVGTNVHVDGAEDAAAKAREVRDALDELNDRDINITTHYRSVGDGSDVASQSGGSGDGTGLRLGGVAGYAHGGMVTIHAGEAKWEMLDFPNGRHGIAATDGLYTVPQGTMVTPHPASVDRVRGMGGGMSFTVHIEEVNGFAGVDELLSTMERMARAKLAGLGMD